MQREVEIAGSIFIVNSFSSACATESLDDLLRRVVTNKAKRECKKSPCIGSGKSEKTLDLCAPQSEHGNQ